VQINQRRNRICTLEKEKGESSVLSLSRVREKVTSVPSEKSHTENCRPLMQRENEEWENARSRLTLKKGFEAIPNDPRNRLGRGEGEESTNILTLKVKKRIIHL